MNSNRKGTQPKLDVSALEQMDVEVIKYIFGKLSAEDILNLSRTSKKLHAIAQDQMLWKVKYQEYFPEQYKPIKDYPVDGFDWRQQFWNEYRKIYRPAAKAKFSWAAVPAFDFLAFWTSAKTSKGKKATNFPLEQLPPDVILHIASFLTPKDKNTLAFVNRNIREILTDNTVAKSRFKKYFPQKVAEKEGKLAALQATLDQLNERLANLTQEKPSVAEKDISKNKAEIEKLKNSILRQEKSIVSFWHKEFIIEYPKSLHLQLSKELQELYKQIVSGDVDGVNASLSNKKVWKALASDNKKTNLPLLFDFLTTARVLGQTDVLNRFYDFRANSPFAEWVMAVICAQPLEVIQAVTGNQLDITDNYGFSPLHYATFVGDHALSQTLIDHGATLDIPSVENTHWMPSISLPGLKRTGFSILGDETFTPLHLAMQLNDTEQVKTLLDKGALNTPNQQGITPLMVAVKKNNVELVRLALNAPQFKIDFDAFKRAVLGYKFDIVELMLQHLRMDEVKTFINDTFIHGRTNLFHTLCQQARNATGKNKQQRQNEVKMARLLLNNGADVNRHDSLFINDYQTPLQIAAGAINNEKGNANPNLDFVDLLLDYGADPSTAFSSEYSSARFSGLYDVAIYNNNVRLAEILVADRRDKGVDFDMPKGSYLASLILSPNQAERIILEADIMKFLRTEVISKLPANASFIDGVKALLGWYTKNQASSLGLISSRKKSMLNVMSQLEQTDILTREKLDAIFKKSGISPSDIKKDAHLKVIVELIYKGLDANQALTPAVAPQSK